MQFGVAKCGIIGFTGHLAPRLDNPLDIRLHGQLVSRVESYKYLGVLIDSKLDHSAWLKQKRAVGTIPALVLVSSDQTAIQGQILTDTTSQTKDSQATTLVCFDGDSTNMWRLGIAPKQLFSTSIAHLVVECKQVTGHRIQSELVPAIQKSRLRLLGRALDPGVENVYTWLRGGVLNGEADLDQRWLDGTVEHESMGTRHDNRALAARLADFLQVAYRQYQSTLWKYHWDHLV
ncbi:hypothetical protein BASA50_005997 [Batrachochytrium salamandrivorans]|uniref:Uncharacterized protein n=1 Tax=Batrachochytrium salamandrivorans TaxID=1357716 RepID=A0ABQ8FB32_9FUNG|nr:hypothetical protein BASA50_005997 [Batrachochytrium salamandrivorans]